MNSWVTPALLALWLVFLATHLGLSSQRLRPRLVERLGDRAFLGVYSAVALAIFIPLATVYAMNKHAGEFLWYGSAYPWMRAPVYVAMVLALTLVVGSFLTPSPASLAPGTREVRGVLRITRHPLFMGVALFGLLHLLVMQVYSADLAFFGGLPLVGLIGCWHQDQRNLASSDNGFESFYNRTSFLPFGRGGLGGLLDSPIALGAGLLLTVLIRVFHPEMFGGA
jgi:uncharacterized membrane protein